MNPKQKFYLLKSEKLIEAVTKRKMEAYYCDTKQDALKKSLEIIKEGSTISWGGSQSVAEIGLIDELRKGNYNLLDRATAQTQEEIHQIYFKAFNADYYLMSTNALTLDGKLVNMDGNGNRVAALIYGPKNVIIVTGINKIVETEEQAIKRVRSIASPMNAIRLNTSTPCNSTATCYDCKDDNCICCNLVITRMSRIKNRIKIIIVGEELGY